MKTVKEKKVHGKLIRFNFIKSIYLKKIVVQSIFFQSIYINVCFMMNMLINDVKIKTLFNNDIKINCMLKKLIDAMQFLIHQKINIVIINFINERVHFFNVCELIFINIENIIISTFIFVIKRSDHDFLLNRLF